MKKKTKRAKVIVDDKCAYDNGFAAGWIECREEAARIVSSITWDGTGNERDFLARILREVKRVKQRRGK